jgi:hypothetical protein
VRTRHHSHRTTPARRTTTRIDCIRGPPPHHAPAARQSTSGRQRLEPPLDDRLSARQGTYREGGHYAIQEAVAAQFTKPPPREAFRPFARLQRTRNQVEYDDISPITADDVQADAETVRTLHAMAALLTTQLPIFADGST